MAKVLVVAHRTALSQELLDALHQLRTLDPESEFHLLVPATPTRHLQSGTRIPARLVAEERAEEAAAFLRQEAFKVSGVSVGPESPLEAISLALHEPNAGFDEIVIATLPLGLSRWLKLDIIHRACALSDLPVHHVVAVSWQDQADAETNVHSPCDHEHLEPAWDEDENTSVFHCAVCGKNLPREAAAEKWAVWKP